MALKPIKVQTYLVQNLLIILTASLTLLGFVLSAYNVTFWNGSWGKVIHGSIEQHVVLGVVPLAHLGYFTSFIFLYLLFEFYGFKHAFYTSFNLGLLILGTYGLFQALKLLPLDNADVDAYREYRDFLSFTLKDVYSIVAAIIAGNTVTFTLAALIKKLTRSYLMFLRFIPAALAGFAVFVGVRIFLVNWNVLAPISMLMMAVTPMAQFAVGIIGMVIPLYLLRMLLGLFRGRGEGESTDKTPHGKGIFKTSGGDLALVPVQSVAAVNTSPPQTNTAYMPPAPVAPVSAPVAPLSPTQPGPNGGTILFPSGSDPSVRS